MNHKEKILSNSFDPNKDKERFKRKRFEIRKRLDILDFRRRKLKELYDEENEELKFELMSKSQKRNSNAPIESCQKEPILTNNNSSPNVKVSRLF